MILQVPADAGQIGDHRHADRAEMLGGPDPGQHEELRGVDAAAAENHLARGVGQRRLPAADVLDADRAPPLARGSGRSARR